jgi:Ca-activated chloride channel family protein
VLTNIEFCVDISGSMTAQFGDGSRYDASMKSIDSFLDFRKGDAFGLTFFGNNVLHWTPLTTDPSAIRCAPPFMRPENAPPWFGGTMIAKALLACREILVEREEGDRMIILVTDGYSWDLSNGVDEEVGHKLRNDRIMVHTVHVAEGEIPKEVATIANITGGEAFKADDPEGLRAVFQRIDKMQQTRLEKTSAETMDDFEPWCVVGLAILSLALLCAFGLRYTPW